MNVSDLVSCVPVCCPGPKKSSFQEGWGRHPLWPPHLGGTSHPGRHSQSTRPLRISESVSECLGPFSGWVHTDFSRCFKAFERPCVDPCRHPGRSEDSPGREGNRSRQWLRLRRSLHPRENQSTQVRLGRGKMFSPVVQTINSLFPCTGHWRTGRGLCSWATLRTRQT